MKKIAVYPGSFDPVTNGHIDLIKRTLGIVDELIVAVVKDSGEKPLFSVEERMAMLKEVTKDLENVRIDSFDELLVDYARKLGAKTIIRGLRAISDFEYEFQMALMNRKLSKEIETVFMMPSAKYSYLSSSMIKEVVSFGGSLCDLVPKVVEERLKEKLAKK
ncbi:pantetheine-phosphate adenylyltransferase [bacterium]|nr:pantetheine-phosphate adenylyltransferase [bacterium]